LEPNHTLATQRLSGRKKNKERLLIVLCANADGSHKIDPLWILEFDRQVGLKYQGQRVLLLLDNCPSHDIGNITLRFTEILSANANSDLQSSLENFRQTTNPVLNDIADTLNILNLLDSIQVEEYLAIPEENIAYEVPSNDQVITELVETFRTNKPINIDLEDEDDSFEAPIVSTNMAIASLKTM
ncbi:4211_t:CDS:2, partial [Dentiscutata heterogama]